MFGYLHLLPAIEDDKVPPTIESPKWQYDKVPPTIESPKWQYVPACTACYRAERPTASSENIPWRYTEETKVCHFCGLDTYSGLSVSIQVPADE